MTLLYMSILYNVLGFEQHSNRGDIMIINSRTSFAPIILQQVYNITVGHYTNNPTTPWVSGWFRTPLCLLRSYLVVTQF